MSDTKKLLEAQNRRYQILLEKWKPIIEHEALGPSVNGYDKKRDLAVVLENQNEYNETLLKEAAPNNNTTGIQNWDPVLIGLVRRSMPKLIGYELFGVQPMSGPTGLVFAMKSRYGAQNGVEAGYNTVDTAFSGTGSVVNSTDPFATDGSPPTDAYSTGTGYSTAIAEEKGTGSPSSDFNEMSFSIERISVTAKSRGLRAKYTPEMAQDLMRMHGLDAQQELAQILSTEILQEQNRELLVMVNKAAKLGCARGTGTVGTFDVAADSSGRWEQERWSALRFRMNIEAGEIARGTRRGRGNWIVTTHDVAAALAEAGRLLPGGDSTNPVKLNVDVDEATDAYAGVLDGRYKVYVDTLFTPANGADYHYATVGYKGTNRYDAGMFYCPYVPIEMYQAIGENSFQPRIGFKTRYGIVANPLSVASAVDQNAGYNRDNEYYRIFKIINLT